jgi:uncharacterized protein (TIGR02118 family)
MVREILGDAVKKIEVFKGLGAVGGQPPSFTVISHLYFDSMEAFTASLSASNGEKIFQDIPNYTDIEAILQIEEPV